MTNEILDAERRIKAANQQIEVAKQGISKASCQIKEIKQKAAEILERKKAQDYRTNSSAYITNPTPTELEMALFHINLNNNRPQQLRIVDRNGKIYQSVRIGVKKGLVEIKLCD